MMKQIILGALLGFGLVGMAAADPVYGTWKTEPGDNGGIGYIQIAACGDKICGTLVKSFDAGGAETQSPNLGRKIIWDMVADSGGNYDSGQIWAPDRDKTYKSKMTLSGNGLAVKGCVLGICRDGETWTRVN